MNPARKQFPFALFTFLMVLDVGVLIVEKTASIHAESTGVDLLLSYLSQPWVWLILLIKVAQFRIWTVLLTRMDLSLAFPLTALAIPITMAVAVVVFHDHLGWRVWIGSLLITAGIIVAGPDEGHPHDALAT
ncbi:MAG: hypothetical protein ACTHM6_03590 [Tepidisphaeraceae bacterium]